MTQLMNIGREFFEKIFGAFIVVKFRMLCC